MCPMKNKRKMLNQRIYGGTKTAADDHLVNSRFDIRPYHMYPARRFKTEPKTQVHRLGTEKKTREKYQQELRNRLKDKSS